MTWTDYLCYATYFFVWLVCFINACLPLPKRKRFGDECSYSPTGRHAFGEHEGFRQTGVKGIKACVWCERLEEANG